MSRLLDENVEGALLSILRRAASPTCKWDGQWRPLGGPMRLE